MGGTPWHAHHIAERYGLLVIITLGEVVLGTILAISAVVEEQDWSVEAALVAFGGTLLAFAMWWVYFTMPSAKVLHAFPRARVHVGIRPLLHLRFARRRRVRGCTWPPTRSRASPTSARSRRCSRSSCPCVVFSVALFTLYSLLLRQFDPFHIWLFIGSIVMLVIAVWAVSAGASMGTGIVLTALSPVVVIVGYETVGHRHQAAALERALAD